MDKERKNMKKKKLGIALCLSAMLLFGMGLNVCAGSGTYRSGEIIVGYGSSVTSNSGYAYTAIAGGGTGTASVSAEYHTHNNVTYEPGATQSRTASNGTAASLSFSAATGYTSSYIYATHGATVGGTTIPTQSSSDFYQDS